MNIVDGKLQPRTKDELMGYITDLENTERQSGQLISDWDVSLITDMSSLFRVKNPNIPNVFNSDISKWDVRNVTNMKEMFYGCHKFNMPLNDWNVGNVTNMEKMFF